MLILSALMSKSLVSLMVLVVGQMLVSMQEYMPVSSCLIQLKLLEKLPTMLIPFWCWKRLMLQLRPWVPQQPALLP